MAGKISQTADGTPFFKKTLHEFLTHLHLRVLVVKKKFFTFLLTFIIFLFAFTRGCFTDSLLAKSLIQSEFRNVNLRFLKM